MNRPRLHKVLSDLWSNRVRSLLVVASITIGLFAIGVIATLYAVITEDMQNGYAATNPANVFISTRAFNKDFIDHLSRLDGVRQAEGARITNTRLEASPGEWVLLRLKSVPDFNEMQINQVRLLEGSWPPKDREIVLEESKIAKTNAQLGDTAILEMPSGKTRQVKVTGIVQDQSIGAGGTGTGGFFSAPAQGYVTQNTLDWLQQAQPYQLNTVYITINGDSRDQNRLDTIANNISDDMKKNGLEASNTSTRSSFEHPNRTLVQAISSVLFFLGFLVVFLSSFLITNTLQALMDQQVQQIGIMKTVGARRGQIIILYMALILIFGMLAFAIAVPLANQASFRLLELLSDKLNIALQGQRFVPMVIVIQGLLAVIVPQAAAFTPIWQGAQISVQEALSGVRQNAVQTGGWIDRRLAQIRRLSRPMRISLRNVFRRKGRLILTLITLTMGGAVFIATFNVQVSMNNYINQMTHYFLADVNLTLGRPYRMDEVRTLLSDFPEISHIEGWASARSELIAADGSAGENVQLLAPPAGSQLVEPILLAGRWLQPGDQNAIVLNEEFMSRFPNLHVGDTLRMRVNGDEHDWVVVGFFQFAGRVTGFIAYTNYEYLSNLIGMPNQAVLYRIVANPAGMSAAQQEVLAQKIEQHLRDNNIPIADITTGSTLSQMASDGFNVLTAFLLFMAMLTALVGSIGLTGTMSMNVLERTREIGVMRAIGASDKILMRMVIVEGMLIGLISWLLGSALAFPISGAMSESISRAIFDAPSNFGFTITGFAIWLVMVILLSILASVMPARNAARLTIREVLSYE